MVTFAQALADRTDAVEAAIARLLTAAPEARIESMWIQWAQLKAGAGGLSQADTEAAVTAALNTAGLQNLDAATDDIEPLLNSILEQLQAEQAIAPEVWTDATGALYYKVASFDEISGEFVISSALPDGTPYAPTGLEQLANSENPDKDYVLEPVLYDAGAATDLEGFLNIEYDQSTTPVTVAQLGILDSNYNPVAGATNPRARAAGAQAGGSAIACAITTGTGWALEAQILVLFDPAGEIVAAQNLDTGMAIVPPPTYTDLDFSAKAQVEQVYDNPVGNGVLVAAPAEAAAPAAIAYEPGATVGMVQVRSGAILFADGQDPATAPLIFELTEGDYYVLDSAKQIQNFRYTSLGTPDAEISIQQFGPEVGYLTAPVVTNDPPPLLDPINDQDVFVDGALFSLQPVNTGGTTGVIYTAAGLPPTLSIDSSTGLIAGTLLASDIGTTTVTVTATAAAGVSSESFDLVIASPPGAAGTIQATPASIRLIDRSVPTPTGTITETRWRIIIVTTGDEIEIVGVPGSAPTAVTDTRAIATLAHVSGNIEDATLDTSAGAANLVGAGDLDVHVHMTDSFGVNLEAKL